VLFESKPLERPTRSRRLVNLPEPPSPGKGEAIVGVEFSPINFNNLLLLRGMFHYTPALPTVVGNEGVGTVEAVGPGVTNVKVGDRVLVPIYTNAWRERVLLDAGKLVPLPSEGDPKQYAMLRINPVGSHLLLTEYGNLKPGDFVIQNAANSGVGWGVIAFGRLRGLPYSSNFVRNTSLVKSGQLMPSATKEPPRFRTNAMPFRSFAGASPAGPISRVNMNAWLWRFLPPGDFRPGSWIAR